MASDVSGPQVALTACSSSTNPSGPTPYCTLSLTGGLEDKNGDLALIREAHAAGSGAKISKSPSARQRHGSVGGCLAEAEDLNPHSARPRGFGGLCEKRALQAK